MLVFGVVIGLWCVVSLPVGALVGYLFRKRSSVAAPVRPVVARPSAAAKPFVAGRPRDVRSALALDMTQTWPTTISLR
jgi:hypothetical protein